MIVSVVSNKGGVGKTTTAIHLAHYFNTEHGGAALIDGDRNYSAILWSLQGDNNGLGFPVVPLGSEVTAPHVVIDSPARPTPAELKTIAQTSDLVIIPTPAAVMDLGATIKMLQEAPIENHRILLTLGDSTGSDMEHARDLLEEMGYKVLRSRVYRSRAFLKAQDSGVTVDRAKHSKARSSWLEYLGVGEEIVNG
jgi:chromosome partitioning protein